MKAAIARERILAKATHKKTYSFLSLLLVLLMLASCVPHDGLSEDTAAPGPDLPVWTKAEKPTEVWNVIGTRPPRDETLIIATDRLFDGWISPLNGIFSQSSPLNLIYEPLLAADPDRQSYIPVFAGSLRFDGSVLHITTDDTKTWHDGTPVTLADVIYSLERWQRLQVDPLLETMTLTVEDESHLIVSFPETTPTDRIVYTMSRLYMLPRHIFFSLEQQSATAETDNLADLNLIGSGPYRLSASDDFSVHLTRVRETDPYPAHVEIPRYGDDASRRRAVETGQADIWYGRFFKADTISSEAGEEALYSLWLNSSRESLQTPAVRWSLARSYRRVVVAARLEVTNKNSFISYQYFGSNQAAAELDQSRFSESEPHYATSEAARAMRAAGMQSDSQGYYILNAGKTALELVYPNRSLYKPLLEQFQSEVGASGFPVKLVPVDENEYLRRRQALDFDLLFDVSVADDRPAAIEARVGDLIRLIDTRDEDTIVSLHEASGKLYENAETVREAKHDLALALQRSAVVLHLDSASYAYLNLHRGVWGGDLSELSSVTDPFGRDWRVLFEWLHRSQSQGVD